jgi:hypothetical protein
MPEITVEISLLEKTLDSLPSLSGSLKMALLEYAVADRRAAKARVAAAERLIAALKRETDKPRGSDAASPV